MYDILGLRRDWLTMGYFDNLDIGNLKNGKKFKNMFFYF
jgi:hypothetical protein